MVFLGVLGGQSVLAGVLHLLLAFPSGRLTGARTAHWSSRAI